LWYYRALVGAFREAGTSPLVEELDRVVSELERLTTDSVGGGAGMTSKELYLQEGHTVRTIQVRIGPEGKVVLSSLDFPGPAVRGFVGDASEYEYWTEVPAAAKDELLLALLVDRYEGKERAVEDFRDWCKARRIPHQFVVWPSDYDC
jgi:hypothetical protein